MTRKFWLASALALALVGGVYAKQHPADSTTTPKVVKKHHRAKKSHKTTATTATQPAGTPAK
jgi:hypothetical protein